MASERNLAVWSATIGAYAAVALLLGLVEWVWRFGFFEPREIAGRALLLVAGLYLVFGAALGAVEGVIGRR